MPIHKYSSTFLSEQKHYKNVFIEWHISHTIFNRKSDSVNNKKEMSPTTPDSDIIIHSNMIACRATSATH